MTLINRIGNKNKKIRCLKNIVFSFRKIPKTDH